jgi:hypothetical protein
VAQELVKMSSKELDRLAVVRKVLEGRLTQAKAGEFIGLSERQVRRLCAAFGERGPAGLVRGQLSNRRLPDELRSQAIEIVRERYADFGPTLACEKLLELHDLRVSKETLACTAEGDNPTAVAACANAASAPRPIPSKNSVQNTLPLSGSRERWISFRAVGS